MTITNEPVDLIPSVDHLVGRQRANRDYERTWLSRCRELASFNVPLPLFDAIPEVVWRIPVWGNCIVVVHAPQVERTEAGLHIPDNTQRKAAYGWVVSVGERVCVGDDRQASIAGPVCPYEHPLLLVGTFVGFNLFSVKEMTFTSVDGGFGRPTNGPRVSRCIVSDVWWPVIDVKPTDWAAEQTNIVLRVDSGL